MSNVVAFNPSQVPAFAKLGVSELGKTLAGSGAAGKRISIKGGVFRLYDAGKEIAKIDERYLDVAIVAAAPKIGRTYYAGTYVEGENAAPACWSADGEKPDGSIKEPQHSNCADCPQNIKGSGQNDTRACRFSQRLAVVLANDVGGSVMQLQLPAASIFGKGEGDSRPLQSYARFLATQKIGPDMVVTRLRFDTDFPSPKLFFSAQRWLTEEEFAKVGEQGKSDDAIAAITMTVYQTDGGEKTDAPLALAGKPPTGKPTAVKAAEPDAEAPAPAKRAKADPAPVVAPKAALDELVNAWANGGTDDEAA